MRRAPYAFTPLAALAPLALASCSLPGGGSPPRAWDHACIMANQYGNIVPLGGYPFNTLQRAWRARGGSAVMDGPNVLVLTSPDPLTKRNNVIRLEVASSAAVYQTEQCGPATVLISRVAANGQVLGDQDMQDTVVAVVGGAARQLELGAPKTIGPNAAPSAARGGSPSSPAPGGVAAEPSAPVQTPDSSEVQVALPAYKAPFGLPRGQLAQHACSATFKDRELFTGQCMVNTKGENTEVFSPKDGCTFSLEPRGAYIAGFLRAYRDRCELANPQDEAEVVRTMALGALEPQGNCLSTDQVRLCVSRE